MPRDPLHTPPSELTVDQIGELAGPSSAFDGIPETVTDLERFTTMDGRNLDQLAFKRRHPSNLQLVSVESMTKWLTAHRGLSREQAPAGRPARCSPTPQRRELTWATTTVRTWNGSATTTTISTTAACASSMTTTSSSFVDYYGDEQGRHDEAELDR